MSTMTDMDGSAIITRLLDRFLLELPNLDIARDFF